MGDGDALLAAILARPDEDTPRLVYADWLEENGQGGYAGFVRDTVWMAANHTDCPVLMADLKSGRPVPLRCGSCGYCRTRRRAEQFYGRHPWLDVYSYAVCFEPTPFDGEIPTGPGLTLVVRRGFVDEVRAPLAALFPATKRLFARHPVTAVSVTDREPHADGPRTFEWVGSPRVSHPPMPPYALPVDLRRFLGGRVRTNKGSRTRFASDVFRFGYDSAADARADLSAAFVRYGRWLCGRTAPTTL
jgi:uncharacterized protein (TIGR02996 family)